MTTRSFLRPLTFLIAAILLASVAPPSQADALLDCATIAHWGERGLEVDFAVHDGLLAAADGRGLALWDIHDPQQPRLLGIAATSSPSTAVAFAGESIAVLAGGSVRRFRSDAGGPPVEEGAPLAAAATLLGGGGEWLATAGTELILWTRSASGWTRTDAVSTEEPRAIHLDAEHERLFLADGSGVRVFDLSEGDLNQTARIASSATDLAADASSVFVARGAIAIFDLTGTSKLTGFIGQAEARALKIELEGTRLFVGDGRTRVRIFDVTDVAAPQLLGSVETPASVIEVAEDHLFSNGSSWGRWGWSHEEPIALTVHSLANPAEPLLVAEIPEYGGPLSGVATDGRFAWLADPPHFRLVDLRKPTHPLELQQVEVGDGADSVRWDGAGRVITYGDENVHQFDVASGDGALFLGTYYSLGAERGGATFAGDYLIEANRASGFHLLDVSDPANPIQLSGLKNDGVGQWADVIATDTTAYGAVGDALKLVDIRNPHSIRVNALFGASAHADLELTGLRAPFDTLLALRPYQLTIIDISVPLEPEILGIVPIPNAVDVAVDGRITWVVSSDGTIRRIDLGDGTNAWVTHVATGLTDPLQVSAGGDLVLVADRFRLRVLEDFSNLSRPVSSAPTLVIGPGTTRDTAELRWSGAGTVVYELQVASEPSFAHPDATLTSGDQHFVPYGGVVHARIRGVRGCLRGPWSNVLTIDSSAFGRRRPARR
ncbi:MAG TPA: hypothetical protein VM534_03350 [Thermoanaerobaculia bacterium]|nr:hypothetical protein [Thermoanaerobaculia bacterium]